MLTLSAKDVERGFARQIDLELAGSTTVAMDGRPVESRSSHFKALDVSGAGTDKIGEGK